MNLFIILGLSVKINKEDPSNSVFIPFCKVGTGYSKKELMDLRAELKPFLVKCHNKPYPSYFYKNWKPAIDDKPDAYVDSPEHSKLFEVKAAEIIRSHQWPSEFTLRFPRAVKIRYDKDWHECMTLRELQDFTQNIVKKKKKGSDSEGSEEPENEQAEGQNASKKTKKHKEIEDPNKKKKLNTKEGQVLR